MTCLWQGSISINLQNAKKTSLSTKPLQQMTTRYSDYITPIKEETQSTIQSRSHIRLVDRSILQTEALVYGGCISTSRYEAQAWTRIFRRGTVESMFSQAVARSQAKNGSRYLLRAVAILFVLFLLKMCRLCTKVRRKIFVSEMINNCCFK